MEVSTPQESWIPNDKQAEFLSLPSSVFEGLYGGAAGGGKSEVLLMLPIVMRWVDHPNFHGIIFRRTFKQLDESLIPRAKEKYELYGAKYNAQEKAFHFPSGAIIRLFYLETDQDARDHKTTEYNYVAFDELTEFSAYQYLYITSRVRKSRDGLPACVRAASNPGGIGHSWVYDRFVKPCETGHVLIRLRLPNGKETKIVFIPALLTDNVNLMQADPDYINRLNLLPEAERKALIYGDWHAFSGQVFTELRTQHYPDEPENAIHVIDPFVIPEWWPKIIAADWGFTAMTWVGWAAISPDNRTFLYREYAERKKYIAEWGADIARLSQFDGNIKARILDPSGWAERGDPKPVYKQLEEASGMKWEKGINDRIGGKLLMHEYLRWRPRPQRYVPPEGYQEDLKLRIFRLYGEDRAREYEKLFQPEPPELNLPKLQIFRGHAPHFLEAIQACVPSDKRPEDVQEFNGDDPYDGGRYLIQRVHQYVQEAVNEFKKRQSLDKILKTADVDMNAFYRRMEKYDSQDTGLAPVRRYHRARGLRNLLAN